LIVEDEALVAESLREFLNEEGYTIAGIVSTGEDAILRFHTMDLDLLVMDVRLAGNFNGIQTVSLIHQTREIPVVFVTAFGEDLVSRASGISPSLYRYITKPFSQDELLGAIRSLLNREES
jgi:DNA-binding response OmpR family regulator